MVVSEATPLRPVEVSGSVTPWREQDIAFEVTGRVEMIADRQTYLLGRWKEGTKIRKAGEVLARIDSEPFQIARDTAQANLSVSQRELTAANVELERVFPARLKVAEVQLVRAEAELKRKIQAFDDNAVAEIEVIRSTADRDTRKAEVEQVNAAIEQQKAKIEAIKASIAQAREQVRQAEYDLERCTLYAPFDGEVSDLFIVAGGHARVGERVAHMIMMDPMRVNVAVSAETARAIGVGDSVNLFLQGSEKPRLASVIEIATAADPKTRTFRVSLMARNQRRLVDIPLDDPRQKATRIDFVLYLSREDFRSGVGPMYVEEVRALRKDTDGYYVWHISGAGQNQSLQSGSMVAVTKVRVVPGEELVQRGGIFRFRSLKDAGGLKEGARIALDVPDDFAGTELLVAKKEWMLKAGQVVSAVLSADVPQRGLYVPMGSVIAQSQDAGAVFLVDGDVVRRVPVSIHASVGAYFRVEASDESTAPLLKDGCQVVLDYIHFLRDGEQVKVTRSIKGIQ